MRAAFMASLDGMFAKMISWKGILSEELQAIKEKYLGNCET